MKHKVWIVGLLMSLVLLGGCQTLSPKAKLLLAETTTQGLMKTYIELHQAGQIGQDEAAVCVKLFERANAILQLWHDGIMTGGIQPREAAELKTIHNDLAELLTKGGSP